MITEATPGWICPKCKHEAVNILASVYVYVSVEGCDTANNGGFEWNDDSPAPCSECGWTGTANDAAIAAQEKYPELTA